MSKTPEELAEEYLDQDEIACSAIDHAAEHLVKKAFLDGYQAAKPQWVSVKERLPESTPMVLAMCTNGYELAYYGAYGQGWTNTLGTEHLNVTHWHPLPKPPKEEK
jgi:hypothetical protein